MITLAPAGRITVEVVEEEIERLRTLWRYEGADQGGTQLEVALGKETAGQLDSFNRVQFAEVVRICRSSTTLSDSGSGAFLE